jgi:hypothetical protein
MNNLPDRGRPKVNKVPTNYQKCIFANCDSNTLKTKDIEWIKFPKPKGGLTLNPLAYGPDTNVRNKVYSNS